MNTRTLSDVLTLDVNGIYYQFNGVLASDSAALVAEVEAAVAAIPERRLVVISSRSDATYDVLRNLHSRNIAITGSLQRVLNHPNLWPNAHIQIMDNDFCDENTPCIFNPSWHWSFASKVNKIIVRPNIELAILKAGGSLQQLVLSGQWNDAAKFAELTKLLAEKPNLLACEFNSESVFENRGCIQLRLANDLNREVVQSVFQNRDCIQLDDGNEIFVDAIPANCKKVEIIAKNPEPIIRALTRAAHVNHVIISHEHSQFFKLLPASVTTLEIPERKKLYPKNTSLPRSITYLIISALQFNPAILSTNISLRHIGFKLKPTATTLRNIPAHFDTVSFFVGYKVSDLPALASTKITRMSTFSELSRAAMPQIPANIKTVYAGKGIALNNFHGLLNTVHTLIINEHMNPKSLMDLPVNIERVEIHPDTPVAKINEFKSILKPRYACAPNTLVFTRRANVLQQVPAVVAASVSSAVVGSSASSAVVRDDATDDWMFFADIASLRSKLPEPVVNAVSSAPVSLAQTSSSVLPLSPHTPKNTSTTSRIHVSLKRERTLKVFVDDDDIDNAQDNFSFESPRAKRQDRTPDDEIQNSANAGNSQQDSANADNSRYRK